MLCFVPPVFRAPDYPPFSSSPEVGGAAAFIIVSIAAVGLLTPVGWSRSQPEYALRVGVASRLGPRAVEQELMSRLDVSKIADASAAAAVGAMPTIGPTRRTPTFFARREAYDAIPPGLELDPATGALVGVPTMAGSYTVALGVTDGTSTHAMTGPSFRVKVLPAL